MRGRKRNPERELVGYGEIERNNKDTFATVENIKIPYNGFTPKEREQLQAVADTLIAKKVLTEIDIPAWDLLVSCFQEFNTANSEIKKWEKTREEYDNGDWLKFRMSLYRWRSQSLQDLTRMLMKFGLTPTERNALIPVDETEGIEDPLELVIQGM